MSLFKLHSEYKPGGDQPKAIKELLAGLEAGEKSQMLLGITGSGKTFTMANVIAASNRPSLIMAHNKTCLLYTSPSPRDRQKSRMPSSA